MILSIQLPFTVFLQVHLTSSERVMGKYQNSRFTKYLLLRDRGRSDRPECNAARRFFR